MLQKLGVEDGPGTGSPDAFQDQLTLTALHDHGERDDTVVDFAFRLLAGLVRSGNAAAVRDVLPEALPWTTFLPAEEMGVFLAELSSIARGAADLHNVAPVAALLAQWRHTAEIYADPELREILTAEPAGDLGPAPKPGR